MVIGQPTAPELYPSPSLDAQLSTAFSAVMGVLSATTPLEVSLPRKELQSEVIPAPWLLSGAFFMETAISRFSASAVKLPDTPT